LRLVKDASPLWPGSSDGAVPSSGRKQGLTSDREEMMVMFRMLSAVPAYIATAGSFPSAPFIVSLLMYDVDCKPRLPPAVEAAIDRTIAITGRQGLATLIVADDADLPAKHRTIQAALMRDDAIILFRCQSADTAERLMQYLGRTYQLALVQEAHTAPAGR
jgi:hypothetical protein